MVKLPYINTGERTLCQDNGVNPSSFWQSVAQKDQGEVYVHPEYSQRSQGSRDGDDRKARTYDYSPRTKATHWDWHHERPLDRVRTRKSQLYKHDTSQAPSEVTSSTRDGRADYIKDYSDPKEYAREFGNKNSDSSDLRGNRSERDFSSEGRYDNRSQRSLSNREGYHIHADKLQINGALTSRDEITHHQTDSDVRGHQSVVRGQNDLTDHHHVRDHHDVRNDTRHHNDVADYVDNRERYDTGDGDGRRYDDVSEHGRGYHRDDRDHPERQYDVRYDHDRTDHNRKGYHNDKYHSNDGGRGDKHIQNGADQLERASKHSMDNRHSDVNNDERHAISRQQLSQRAPMNQNADRYVSETMSKYSYRETPRQDYQWHNPPSREAAVGIIPANEFHKAEEFERMIPYADRQDTFKMSTYPTYSFGRKKKIAEARKVEDESVISDPQPNHYLVNDKLVSRKKFITGPRDSLPVPALL